MGKRGSWAGRTMGAPGGGPGRTTAVLVALAVVAAACAGGNDDEPIADLSPSDAESGDAEVTETSDGVVADVVVDALPGFLPPDTRGIFAVDLDALLSGPDRDGVDHLLAGGVGPVLDHVFAEIGHHTDALDRSLLGDVVLAQTAGPANDRVVVAATTAGSLDELAPAAALTPVDAHRPSGWEILVDDAGTHLALLPGGWLVAGTDASVRSALDVAVGAVAAGGSDLLPFFRAAGASSDLNFAYGLPALAGEVDNDRSLRGAVVMSGALDVAEGALGGEIAFHLDEADAFAETYNRLNRHAIGGPEAEAELRVVAGVGDGPQQVAVSVPPTPLVPTPKQALDARNQFKKLFVGMEAHDAAEDVVDGGAPWFDLVVKSEADGDDPPSPASVFFRWEFKDQAAIEAFEENELPEGFRLAPTRFFESDDPDGEYFFLLNIYNAGGGSIVGGARAEWDIFVHAPAGGPDPNPGERPRFFVIDALAETVSFDPVNLVTPAEPLSHQVIDGIVTSTVGRLEGGETEVVWESTFPQVDPARNEVTRFTREMAIGNDYIYWGGGALDRALYNGTTINRDAYLVDPADVAFVDNSRWAQYLKPELLDVVYYVNTLEYVVSPLANLDSEQLDVSDALRDELIAFKRNGHQEGLMRKGVEQLFRGVGDAMVGYRIENETPSAYYHFEITDPDGFAEAIELPDGHDLMAIPIVEGEAPAHHLTLSVFEIEGAIEGVRAEWSTTTDRGTGTPSQLVLELLTEDLAIDPVDIIHLPDGVTHTVDGSTLRTALASTGIEFDGALSVSGTSPAGLSLDWIESGDVICRLNGVCDEIYSGAETLDVPVRVDADPTISAISTPWDRFIDPDPVAAFFRDNPQDFAAKRWSNLAVEVEELPFAGLTDATHTISGDGSLVGTDTDVVDSAYTYDGDAVVENGQLRFAIDQQIENGLGVANIFTTGAFDLATGTGSQTVVDCLGPALLCSDITPGTTSIYTADALDASDPDRITWRVDLTLVLTGGFGTAESASALQAVRGP